jgi:hypothetical protein
MSIPRNHHYVSRVLSNKFLSDDRHIYKYSKRNEKITAINSTKGLFSQKDLNTAISEDGNFDHSSVEEQLNICFEKDFPKYYDIIASAVNAGYISGKRIAEPQQIIEAAKGIIEMGFIGRSRHPADMQHNQDVIFGALLEIADNATDELKNGLLSHIGSLSGVTNKLKLDFSELAKGLTELMGETTYSIMIAPEGHYFLLPDCTAATQRFKVKDDVVDGVTFINPAMVIGMVLMAIDSRILISAVKTEFCPGQGFRIYRLDAETMFNYNRVLFDNALEEVACQNQEYLQQFVKR